MSSSRLSQDVLRDIVRPVRFQIDNGRARERLSPADAVSSTALAAMQERERMAAFRHLLLESR